MRSPLFSYHRLAQKIVSHRLLSSIDTGILFVYLTMLLSPLRGWLRDTTCSGLSASTSATFTDPGEQIFLSVNSLGQFPSSTVPGHPRVMKAAVLDIITPDITNGIVAGAAELIILLNDCLHSFPNLAQSYEIHISHSRGNVMFSF